MLALVAHAIDLDSAKSQGLIGERQDGYIGIVEGQGSGEVRQLVADVNAKRKARYESIAQKNGISVGEVQALAGKKAFSKTPSGQWIYDGAWRRK